MKRIFAAIAALSMAAVALPAAAQDWRGQQHNDNQGAYSSYGRQNRGYDRNVGRRDFESSQHRGFEGYGNGHGDQGRRYGR